MPSEYLPRAVDAELAQLLLSVPIVVLDGARATGKTTTARRYVASEIRLPRDLPRLLADPEAALLNAAPPVLVDEWQLAGTDVLWTLKGLVDDDPTPGRFILTGSVAPQSYGPTYPLTGRAARLSVEPMTVQELAGAGAQPNWLRRLWTGEWYESRGDYLKFDFEHLFRTGFPGAPSSTTLGSKPSSTTWLRSYASSVAERSTEERRDPERVGDLIRVLAELESQAVPDERLWNSAHINRQTFVAYDAMLRRARFEAGFAPWNSNRLKRLTGLRKRHLVDHALSLAIAGIDADELAVEPQLAGRYVESFVAAQLRPLAVLEQATLHHLRTAGGEHEIDVVISHGAEITAIEVKSGVDPRPADAKHLRWFRDQVGEQLTHAVVLHRGTQCFELVDGVWAIPLSTFFPLGEA